MRTVSTTLLDAIANGAGEFILRVNTWADMTAYNAAPTVPENAWEALAFNIYSTNAAATLVSENDYTVSDFTVFIIERGILLNGVEYTIKSGIYFVTKYFEEYGKIIIEGTSFPNIKLYIAAGDDTYENVITSFCTAIGKTAVFKNTGDIWLDYQFFPTGKFVRNNKSERFITLIFQKYTLMCYEESPKNLVFYYHNSYESSALKSIEDNGTTLSVVTESGTSKALTSTNGADWSVQTAPNFMNGMKYASEPEIFVAVGASVCSTSLDGITWTSRTIPAGTYHSVTYSSDANLFVAVGASVCATSPDGITWTSRTIPAGTYYAVESVEAGGTFFVAVGASVAVSSGDGITWTSRTIPAGTYYAVKWNEIAGSFFVAVGASVCATSLTGTSWTSRTIPAGTYYGVEWAVALNRYAAVGASVVATSTDGITWTSRTPAALNTWKDIVYSTTLGLFVAVANNGIERTMTSADGITWASSTANADINLTYADGTKSHITRSQSEVHYFWVDESVVEHTSGDVSTPIWNLGFLHSTASPPATLEDPYYKFFLQISPPRLDITDADKVHFVPSFSIDPTKTIDVMCTISEHFDPTHVPTWYQNIKSIEIFDKTESG